MNKAQLILKELESRKNQGAGLEHFRQYLHTIHDPQTAFPTIHIAGTNGKGSTLNYIRSILQEAHVCVGTFSSPYLETHYDRIRINDQFISEADFMKYYEQYHEDWYAYGLSSFEIDTIIAFLYFKEQKVDIAIIETGIGGRYDCTNVIMPLVSVITNIGMDHMDRLGYTKAEIAWQKGGIIKQATPLVTAEQDPDCLRILQNLCTEMHAPLFPVRTMKDVQRHGLAYTYQYDDLSIHLASGAQYQLMNSACAIETMQVCKEYYHMHITNDAIQTGLAKAQWKGRFEIMHHDPLIIIDGAHNEAGIQALCQSIRSMGEVRILFSALKDKDTHHMMEALCAICDDVWVSEFAYDRAKTAKQLAESFAVHVESDYRHVIDRTIQEHAKPLIITGSLYFISEVRAYLISHYQ